MYCPLYHTGLGHGSRTYSFALVVFLLFPLSPRRFRQGRLPSLRDFWGMSLVAVFPSHRVAGATPAARECLLTWEPPPMEVAVRALIIDACLLNLVIYAPRVCTTAEFSLLASRWLIEKLPTLEAQVPRDRLMTSLYRGTLYRWFMLSV